MRLSDDKATHLSHIILDSLLGAPGVTPKTDKEAILREVKRILHAELHVEEEVDSAARKKLASLSRQLPEGSPEWEVRYQAYFREEMNRRGRLFIGA